MATMPSSGALYFSTLRDTFGGANPVYISHYYRGGSRVPATATSVPTSGQISMNQFYGASSYTTPVLSGPGSITQEVPSERPAVVRTWSPGWSASGGNGSYPCSWGKISGSSNASITANGSTANPTFSVTGTSLPIKGMGNGTYTYQTETWRCTLNDGVSSITKDYAITIGFENYDLV
jgi:hypothetical protein